eukprot:1508557-Pleurochrysis_carterae.AAC.1
MGASGPLRLTSSQEESLPYHSIHRSAWLLDSTFTTNNVPRLPRVARCHPHSSRVERWRLLARLSLAEMTVAS